MTSTLARHAIAFFNTLRRAAECGFVECGRVGFKRCYSRMIDPCPERILSNPMTPDEFCHVMLAEYERQWSAAQGHAQRHPLRLKMASLEHLRSRGLSSNEFTEALESGQLTDDVGFGLLCVDLAPRWAAANRGEPYLGT